MALTDLKIKKAKPEARSYKLSDGGSALILSRTPSDMTLDSAYNYSDTANWLGRLDNVESNKSFFFYNVRLIRRLLKEAEIEPGCLASCLPPTSTGRFGAVSYSRLKWHLSLSTTVNSTKSDTFLETIG